MSFRMEPGDSQPQRSFQIPLAKCQGPQVRRHVVGGTVCFCSFLELIPITSALPVLLSLSFQRTHSSPKAWLQPVPVVPGDGVQGLAEDTGIWQEGRCEAVFCLNFRLGNLNVLISIAIIHSVSIYSGSTMFQECVQREESMGWEAERPPSHLSLHLPIWVALGLLESHFFSCGKKCG